MISFFLSVSIFSGCGKTERYDLAILHASVLDVKSGEVVKNRNIFIRNGIIKKITPSETSL